MKNLNNTNVTTVKKAIIKIKLKKRRKTRKFRIAN